MSLHNTPVQCPASLSTQYTCHYTIPKFTVLVHLMHTPYTCHYSTNYNFVAKCQHQECFVVPSTLITHFTPIMTLTPPRSYVRLPEAGLPGLSWHGNGPSVACWPTSLACYTQPHHTHLEQQHTTRVVRGSCSEQSQWGKQTSLKMELKASAWTSRVPNK